MTYFLVFISIIIIQRLSELVISSRNEKYLKSIGAIEIDEGGFKYIFLLHLLFFVSVISEFIMLERGINKFWFILIILFLISQFLRYWAITSLGRRWTTKVLVLKGSNLVNTGPYRYFRHPNYLAVITEIAVIPLIFNCYYTALIFSILNIVLLSRRIKIENRELYN